MKQFPSVASLKRLFSDEKNKSLPSKLLRLAVMSAFTGSLLFNLTSAAPKVPWSATASIGCPNQGTGSDFTEVGGLVYMLDTGTSFYSFNPTTETCTQLANFPQSINANARIVAIDNDTLYANFNSITYRYDISNDRWISMTRAVLDDGTPVSNAGSSQNNGNSIVAYNNELYTLVGNGTGFESYNPTTNTWTTQATTPASTHDGAAMAVVGSNIYAFRGANTTDFWQYNGTTWSAAIAQAPATVEAGGTLAAVGNTIYAFRGNNTKDFWSYDTIGDSWNTGLTDAPDYVRGGGALVTIGTDIYAFQGNDRQNFWKYDTIGGTWDDTLSPFPQKFLGVRGGGSFATDGTDIYATLGGNYRYYYKYTVGTDTWTRLDDIPLAVGADATSAEGGLAYLNNVIYAVTGDGIAGTGTSALGLIWRYPLTGANANTWPTEYKFPTPAGATYGTAMVHPGTSTKDPTGDFFYMLRGQTQPSFWKFTHTYQSYIPFSRSFHDATEAELISQDGSGSSITEGSGNTFVIVNGKIYMVIGGSSQVFVKYDPSTNQWERLMNAPDGISSSAAMTSNNNDTIWLVNSNDTFKYIISQDQWIAGAKMGTDDNGNIYSTQFSDDQSSGNAIVADGNGGLFMANGGGTTFNHWNDDNNSWVGVASLPASASNGFSMVRAGTKIYAIRGSNTKSFYEYDIDTNSWSTLASITSTSNVDEGADIAYPESGDYIYVLIGNLSSEFWRYSISGDSWTQLANTPSTVRAGGSLAIVGNYIYALRGNNTTSFWRYDTTQTPGVDAWNTGLDPADAPANVRSGGNLASDGTNIYATRGAATNEFWRYNIVGDTWTSNLDPHPEFMGADNDLNVYGDLAYDSVSGDIYAVTGFGENDTPLPGETGPLYRYKLSAGAGQFTWPHIDGIPVNPSSTFRGAGFAYPGIGNLLYLSTDGNLWTFNTDVEEWNAFPKALLDNGESISQDGLDMEGRSSSIHYQNGLFYVVPRVDTNFQSYNPTTNKWKQLADVPLTNGAGLGVVETQMLENPTDSDKIFLFVDEGNTLLDDYWYSYDITDDEWTILETPDMDPGCGNITYPGAGDWIYISACDSPPMQHSTWRYSISKELWVNHDLPRFDGYVNGNINTDPTPLADPTDLTLAQSYGGEEVISVNGDLYLLAGGNQMWSFAPSTNTWTQHANTPESQLVSALVYPGGEKIYALFDRNTNFYEYCLPGSGGCTPDTWTLITNTFPAGTGNDTGSSESTNWVDEADLFYPGSGDYIYAAVGGVSNDTLQFCFQNTGSGCTVNTWTKIGEKLDADPNTSGYQYARYTDMATADGNLVYMGTIGHEHVQVYNIATNTWAYSTDAPFTFGTAGSFTSDGTYFWVGQGGNSEKMWLFDPGGSGWTDADFADLPGENTDLGTSSGGWPAGGMTYDSSTDEVWLTTGVARGPNAAFAHSARGAFLWRYKIDPETCDGTGENPGTGSNPCNGYNEWPYYAAVKDNNLGQFRPTALESTGLDNYLYVLPGQFTRTFYRYTIEDKSGTPDRTATDPGEGTWTAMPPHPFPTNGPLMQYADGFFYALRGNYSSNFTRYDFTKTTAASLLGGEISSDNSATWATITDGTFTITIDGISYDIDGPTDTGIDFSSVTSMNDVASIIQTEIRNETGSTETVQYCDDLGSFNDRGYFLFRSATAPGGGGSMSTLGRIFGSTTDISGVSAQGSPPVSLNGASGGHVRGEQTGGDWLYCGATGQPENLPVRIGDTSSGSRSGGIEFVSGLDEIWVAHSSGDSGNSDSDDTGLLWRYKIGTNEWPSTPGPANPPASFDSGGDLTAFDNDTLYALRGANTNQFFEYDINANSWINHSSTDPTPQNVENGGSITSDGTTVYATGGYGTGNFWTYNPAATAGSRWNDGGAPTQAPFNMGSTGGADQRGQIRYDNNTVWAASGIGVDGVTDVDSALLNRYDTVADEWPGISDPKDPSAFSTEWQGGTDLANIDGDSIYALRGGSTLGNNFFNYNILTDTWSALADMPAPDPAVAITDGGNLEAVNTDTIYALRGNDTNEFYRYDVSGNVWESDAIQDFPVNVGTMSGFSDRGDLLHVASENLLYGIPGNGTTVYKMDLDTRVAVEQVNGGVNPEANTPFDIIVQASDANGDPVIVGTNTDVTLTLETGNGNLGGTLTGTILSGNSQGTISGVTYDLPESGVSVRATDTNPGVLLSSVSNTFTVDPATPSITSITPNTGTTMGGTTTVITGTNFTTSTTVTFDSIPSPQVTFDSDTQLTVITPQSNPAGTTGAVDVIITNPGPKIDTEVNGFTYFAPTITNVNPNNGPTAGGNLTTITGNYFGPSIYTLDVDIDNTGAALTDYQVSFEFDTAALIAAGKMRSDCGDIRLYDTGQATPIPYWVETGSCNTTTTRVWTKVDLAAGPSTKTIYAQYGNLSLTEKQNGEDIFDFFDDFDEGSLDTTKWGGDTGQFSVGNGVLENTGTSNNRLSSIQTFSGDQILEVKNITNTTSNTGYMVGGFFATAYNSIGYNQRSGNDYYRTNSSWINIGTEVLPQSAEIIYRYVASGTNVDISAKNQSGTTTYHSATVGSNGISSEAITLGRRYDNVNYTQSYDADWDWIFVRQYAATPPTTTVGTENAQALNVTFGTNSSLSFTRVSETEISATVPVSTTGAGAVDVIVTNGDATTDTESNGYTYNNPAITNINPDNGPEAGGTDVVITGTDFSEGGYNRTISITNPTGGILTDNAIPVSLDTASLITATKMKADCGDIRIEETDGETPLSYWVEDCNSDDTIIWVKVPSLPIAGKDIRMTYGNSGLTSLSSLADVFPTLANNNEFWIRANDGTNATTNGTTVTSWSDQSGNSNDLTNTNGTPIYTTNALNGLPIVRFDGSDDSMGRTGFTGLPTGTSVRTAFMVGEYRSNGWGGFSWGGTGACNGVFGLTVSNSGAYAVQGWCTDYPSSTTANGAGFGLHMGIMNGTGGSDLLQYLNGSLIETDSAANINTLTTEIEIGREMDNSPYVNMDMAEAIVFSTNLSTSEREEVERYLNYKYSLYGSVPSARTGIEQGIGGTQIQVTFDGTPATNINFVNSTTINATTPAHTAGLVDIVVTNPDTQTATLNNGFNYTGAADTTTSTFVAASATTIANGVTTNILTATVNDGGNSPLEGQAVTVAQTGGSGTTTINAVNCDQADVGVITKGTTNSNGEACFAIHSEDITTPGNNTYTATITSIPAAITQTASVEFIADYPDLDDSTFTSAPGTVAADGSTPSTLTATIVDSLGRFITGQTVTVTDDGTATTYSPVSASENTNSSGVADFDVTSTAAQTATFTANLDSLYYDKTTYSEVASPTFINDYSGTGSSLIAGSQGDDVEATTTLPFDFELFGINVPASTNIYVCSNGFISLASTGCPSSGSLSNAIAGFFRDLDTTSGGIYREVASDNNSVRFLWDAQDAGTSNPIFFEIILYQNNTVEFHYFANDGQTARIGMYDSTASSEPDEISTYDNSIFGDSEATRLYNPLTGPVTPGVTQQPQVTFTAGTVDAGNSTIVANPTSAVADGVETSTITVTLRDAFNNPVPGRTVELSDDQGVSQIEYVGYATPPPYPTDVTDVNGEATFDVRSTTVDNVTFTGNDVTGATILIGTADVEFTCIVGPNQQCLQVEIEENPGVLTITAPDDFAFPAITSATSSQEIFSIDSATPYTLDVNDVAVVTDTENAGGFTLQLQASAFEDSGTSEQIPLAGFYAVTQASNTGGTQTGGVEYDSGYAGVTNITTPQNNNTAGNLDAASTFTTNGDNLDSIIDLMLAPVTIAEVGRSGQFKQNIQYYLQIPAFQLAGSYQVTLTFDLTRTPAT